MNAEAFCETLMQLPKGITLLLDNACKPKQAKFCCSPQMINYMDNVQSRCPQGTERDVLDRRVEIEEFQTAHYPTEDLCCIPFLDYEMKAMVKAGMPDGIFKAFFIGRQVIQLQSCRVHFVFVSAANSTISSMHFFIEKMAVSCRCDPASQA